MCFNSHFATGVLQPPTGGPGTPETQLNCISRELKRSTDKELINKVGNSESWREGEKETSASANTAGTILF